MIAIDVALVRALVAEQFPWWAGLPVRAVRVQGSDNRTFRLGDALSVRLPSTELHCAAVEKEDAVLPVLAPKLPLPVPEPVATGVPGAGYPFVWSVRRWLPGHPMTTVDVADRDRLARDLATFLVDLRAVAADGGPAAGRQSLFRGSHLSAYSDEVDRALAVLGDSVDVRGARQVWLDATATAWPDPPVWLHGDVASGNLLVVDGRLDAVIDFGCCAVGDPACDLAPAWTLFAGPARQVFRESVGLDDDTWRRARGWVLWKALVTLAGMSGPDPAGHARHDLAEALGTPLR